MVLKNVNELFTKEVLNDLFPLHRSDEFFEALYGDPDEGAYDISLAFKEYDSAGKMLLFELQLYERPGKCLVCNLTYGLPEVFSRHPLININGIVKKIEEILGGVAKCESWELGQTRTPQNNLHVISLTIQLN